jgi:hypothetical protein
MKFQNGTHIQDGRQTFLSFKTWVFNYNFEFLQDCLNLQIVHLLQKKNLKNSKWPKIQCGRFFAQIFKFFWKRKC